MRNKLFIVILAMSPMVMAENNDVQIERIYNNTSEADYDVDQQQPVTESGAYGGYSGANNASDTANSPQINIYNANSNKNKQDQDQAADATVDFDSKVQAQAESEAVGEQYIARANELRSARKGLEVGTEQKMIEKIEYSRMEDEKDRADRLFGNRLDKKYEEPAYQQPVYQQPVYAEPKQETKVIIVEKEAKKNDYKEESDNYVSEKYEEPVKYANFGEETYVSPLIGTTSYDSVNTSSDMTLGVALGTKFEGGVSVEGSFLYSQVQLDDYDDYLMKDVDQYTLGAGVKYNFAFGRISPNIGALIAYTYREYATDFSNVDSSTSNAFDAGVSAGVDFRVAKNFTIGAEYRIMKNINYDREGKTLDQLRENSVFANNGTGFDDPAPGVKREPLEEVGQQVFLINGKFTF